MSSVRRSFLGPNRLAAICPRPILTRALPTPEKFSVAVKKYWFRLVVHVVILVVAVIAIIFGMKNAIEALIDRVKDGSAQS